MRDLIQVKAEALDARLAVDQAENDIRAYTAQTLQPRREAYEKLLQEAGQIIQEQQEKEKEIINDLKES